MHNKSYLERRLFLISKPKIKAASYTYKKEENTIVIMASVA